MSQTIVLWGPQVVLRNITIEIEVEQDDMSVRGNALASGDDKLDKEAEDKIIQRLDEGDVWAWASVCVVAKGFGLEGREYLGGCCYENEEDFVANSPYYEEMVSQALNDLACAIECRLELCDQMLN